MSERIIFCAHSGVRIRPASHTEQPRRDAVRPSAPPTPAEILAAAAYSPRRSSNANSLCGAVSTKSSKVMAPIQMDFLPDGFRSSNLICPASQLSLRGVISTGGGTLDIPAGHPTADDDHALAGRE